MPGVAALCAQLRIHGGEREDSFQEPSRDAAIFIEAPLPIRGADLDAGLDTTPENSGVET